MKPANQYANYFYRILTLLLLSINIMSCGRAPVAPSESGAAIQETETPALLDQIPTPPYIGALDPLEDVLAIPDLYIVPISVNQARLSIHLKTTPKQLSRFNPHLSEDIAPDSGHSARLLC